MRAERCRSFIELLPPVAHSRAAAHTATYVGHQFMMVHGEEGTQGKQLRIYTVTEGMMRYVLESGSGDCPLPEPIDPKEIKELNLMG